MGGVMCLDRARDDCSHSVDTQKLFKDATCYVRKAVPETRKGKKKARKGKPTMLRPSI